MLKLKRSAIKDVLVELHINYSVIGRGDMCSNLYALIVELNDVIASLNQYNAYELRKKLKAMGYRCFITNLFDQKFTRYLGNDVLLMYYVEILNELKRHRQLLINLLCVNQTFEYALFLPDTFTSGDINDLAKSLKIERYHVSNSLKRCIHKGRIRALANYYKMLA